LFLFTSSLLSNAFFSIFFIESGEVWKWNIFKRPKRIRELTSHPVVSIHAGLGYIAALLASGVVLVKGRNGKFVLQSRFVREHIAMLINPLSFFPND
jgi:hypothetical protein